MLSESSKTFETLIALASGAAFAGGAKFAFTFVSKLRGRPHEEIHFDMRFKVQALETRNSILLAELEICRRESDGLRVENERLRERVETLSDRWLRRGDPD
jgi:hypothetical protein